MQAYIQLTKQRKNKKTAGLECLKMSKVDKQKKVCNHKLKNELRLANVNRHSISSFDIELFIPLQ